jgi:hypothetical protein
MLGKIVIIRKVDLDIQQPQEARWADYRGYLQIVFPAP